MNDIKYVYAYMPLKQHGKSLTSWNHSHWAPSIAQCGAISQLLSSSSIKVEWSPTHRLGTTSKVLKCRSTRKSVCLNEAKAEGRGMIADECMRMLSGDVEYE